MQHPQMLLKAKLCFSHRSARPDEAVRLPDQCEVGVGPLPVVTLPSRGGGGVQGRDGRAGRGGGASPGLRGGEAVPAAQTLTGGKEASALDVVFQTQTQTHGGRPLLQVSHRGEKNKPTLNKTQS